MTVPAGDIADNPYWKRDTRRSYPQLSTVRQADAVGLLTVGSHAAPKDDVLKLGEAGEQQLVAVKAQGEERGLAALFEQDKKSIQGVLGANGLPPNPANINPVSQPSQSKYELGTENGYPEKYVQCAIYPIDLLTRANTAQIHLPHFCLIRPIYVARKNNIFHFSSQSSQSIRVASHSCLEDVAQALGFGVAFARGVCLSFQSLCLVLVLSVGAIMITRGIIVHRDSDRVVYLLVKSPEIAATHSPHAGSLTPQIDLVQVQYCR